MKLRQKLYFSTVLLSLFVAVAVGFVLLCLRHLSAEHEMRRELLEAGASLDRLRVASMGLGGGIKDDAAWLAAAETARKEISDVVKLWDDPASLEIIDSEINSLIAYFKKTNGLAGIQQGSDLSRRTELVDVHFDQAHELALEEELASERRFARLIGTLALSLLVLSLVGALASFVSVRNFVAVVRQLIEGAAALGRGALDHRLSVDARNEFTGLVASFNQMAGNLRKKTVSLDLLTAEVDVRRRAEKSVEEKGRLLFLLEAVGLAANRAERAADALAACAKLVGEHVGWPLGFVYLPDGDGKKIRILPEATYVAEPARYATFTPDPGLPAEVYRSRVPRWEIALGEGARDVGLAGALAFPVLVADEIVAVYHFFSRDPVPPPTSLLEVLTHLGIQLGRAIERHRAIALKAHLEAIFTGSADAVMAADVHGKLTHWNPAAETLFGYTAAEAIGESVRMLHVDDESELLVTTLQRGLPVANEPTRRRRKDGTLVDIALSLATVRGADGAVIGYSGIARDISENRRAEAALRESERRLNEAQSLARLGSWEYDFASQRAIWTDVMYEIFERDRAQGPLDEAAFRAVLHPDDAPHVLRLMDSKLAEARRSEAFDTRVVVPSGAERWVQCCSELDYDEQGRPVRARGTIQDISERKIFERRLGDSEASFRLLFAGNPLPMWVYDLTSLRFVEANDAAVAHYGYTHDEFLAMRATEIGPVVEGGGEIRHLTKSGSSITVETASYAFEREGRRVRLVVVNDITERKVVEHALRLQARALENMAESVHVTDKAGSILYTNAACDRTFGYERGELLGRPADCLTASPADESTRARDRIWHALTETGYWAGDLPSRRKDGATILTHGVLSLLESSDETYCISVQEDITEAREMERKLREREERFRFLLEQLPANVWTTDRELRLIYSAGGTASPQRRDVASFIGYAIAHAAAGDPALEPAVAAHLAALDGKRVNYELDFEGRHYVAHLEPYRDAAGAVQGVLGVSIDITDRQESEEKLRRMATELLRSNRELDEFAHIISHDLQEPLRMVTCYLNLLVQRYGDKLEKPAGEFITFAVDGASRMKELITDLLSFSRVGSRGARFVEFDGEEPLRAAMRNLKVAIEESGARIEAAKLPRVSGDPAQLTQLFQNLVSNSIKFRGTEPPYIRIACEETDEDWVFAVGDNGIGFDMGEAERVFQIFQRLHTRGDYPGSGVGLAVCRRIVNRHGGRIWVDSREGRGSTFYFALPKAPGGSAPTPPVDTEQLDKKTVDFSERFEQNRVVG